MSGALLLGHVLFLALSVAMKKSKSSEVSGLMSPIGALLSSNFEVLSS